MEFEQGAENTDRELWREIPDDYYAPSLHVTVGGGIGMNVGGFVIVLPIREWHALAKKILEEDQLNASSK
jgi:hypothetical protein